MLSCQLMHDKIMAWCNKNKLKVDKKKKKVCLSIRMKINRMSN